MSQNSKKVIAVSSSESEWYSIHIFCFISFNLRIALLNFIINIIKKGGEKES